MPSSNISRASICFATIGLGFSVSMACADEISERSFEGYVQPLLEHYCYRCHGAGEKLKGDLDLTGFQTGGSVLEERKLWLEVLHQIRSEEMPTKEPLPSREERRDLVAWLDHKLNDIDWTKVRDAGHVTIPRLNKTEYNNTMRDLLGVDLRPGETLLDDGEGQSGFTTDRENLFITPTLMEKYFGAAERALDALIALDGPPVERHLESERMFMTETREVPKDFGTDFRGYVLNRGQMTLYEAVEFPSDGLYTFSARALPSGGSIAGARLRINDEIKGDIVVEGTGPSIQTITCFVPKGSHQVAWNIQKPSLPPTPKEKPPPEPDAKEPGQSYTELPKDAGKIVGRKAGENAPRFPEPPGERPPEVARAIAKLNGALVGTQRAYEWLRLHGPNGDPSQLKRFRQSIEDRRKGVDRAFDSLAKATGVPRDELGKQFTAANGDRLDDNRELFAMAAAAQPVAVEKRRRQNRKPGREKAGSIAIDWIKVRGPLKPEGAPEESPVFVAEPGGEVSAAEAAQTIIARFAQRAFRRPVGEDEAHRYIAVFDRASEGGLDFKPAVKLALTSILVSPHFLFRHELAPADEGSGEFALDDFQIASRLSYFLWMSMPDDELFDLAHAGKLHDPEVLRAQVRRMLRDPRARGFTSAFLGQWLGFESLGGSVVPDEKLFPQFDADLAAAMKQETVLTFEHLLLKDGSLLELLDSRSTFLNEKLASHYGIRGVEGEGMREVSLSDRNRGGLLGMASVLTATSSPTRTSPVLRGKWVLETLLGDRIPDPPPDAGQLDAAAGTKKGKTLREELETHRSNAECATCHDKIDPIGFGLENFDAIGRYRTRENGAPIDSSGEIDGFQFAGAGELRQWLLRERKDAFIRNTAERMLAFALGRGIETYDEGPLRAIVAALEADGYKASRLVEEIVMSYPFLNQNNTTSDG